MRFVVALCVALVLLPAVVGQAGERPWGVVGGAGVAMPVGVLVLGGRTVDGPTDAVQRVDAASGAVEAWGALSAPVGAAAPGRYAGAAVRLGDAVYHFGGAGLFPLPASRSGPASAPGPLDEVVRVDLATREATLLPDRLPVARWGLAAVAHEGVAYLVGGYSPSTEARAALRHAEVLRFDPEAAPGARVTAFASLPHEVQDAAVAVLDGRLVVAGGLAAHAPGNACPVERLGSPESGGVKEVQVRACPSDAVVTVDLASGEARVEDARLPWRVQWPAGDAVEGRLVVAGGMLPDRSPNGAAAAWTPRGSVLLASGLDVPVMGAAGVADGRGLLVLGGRGAGLDDVRGLVQRVDAAASPGAPEGVEARTFLAQRFPPRRVTCLAWDAPPGDAQVLQHHVYRDGAYAGAAFGARWCDRDAPLLMGASYRVTAESAAGEGPASEAVTRPGLRRI